MRLARFLLIAAAAVGAGYFLARTDKGKELRRNLADSADKMGKRLNELRSKAEDLLEEKKLFVRKVKKEANGQLV